MVIVMKIKVKVKLPGPQSWADPMASSYRNFPQDNLVDGILDTDKNELELSYGVLIQSPVEGTEYFQYQRKDGLSSGKLNNLNNILETLKSDIKFRLKVNIIQSIFSAKNTDEITNTIISKISDQNISDAERLQLLDLMTIIALIKLYD